MRISNLLLSIKLESFQNIDMMYMDQNIYEKRVLLYLNYVQEIYFQNIYLNNYIKYKYN